MLAYPFPLCILEVAMTNQVTLTKAESNLLAKLNGIVSSASYTQNQVRSNPFTGVQREVSGQVAYLIDFTLAAYRSYSMEKGSMILNGKKIPLSIYDRTRYLIMKLDNEAYFDLID